MVPLQHALHIFWEVLEFLANTLVFFYFGIIISVRIYKGHFPEHGGEGNAVPKQLLFAKDYGYAILSWLYLNLLRLVTIIILKPFLSYYGDGFSWQDVYVCTWAGLRGAVGLSLALIVDLAARNEEYAIDQRCAMCCLSPRLTPPDLAPQSTSST
jgi:NhaP-type Na+/H+ or K+/H+ antiporter